MTLRIREDMPRGAACRRHWLQTKNFEGAAAWRTSLRSPGAKDAMVEEDGDGNWCGGEKGKREVWAWYEIINSTTRFP